MKQRGRKSFAALSVVSVASHDRIVAPDRLTEEQAAIWREICATKPADWFGGDTADLLETLVVCISEQRRIAKALRGFTPECPEYEKLIGLQAKLASQQKSLATAMRLTQQARYGARAAATASDRSASRQKPWEFDGR